MKIEFAYSAAMAEQKQIPWNLRIEGQHFFAESVALKNVSGVTIYNPTYHDPTVPGRRKGWIEIEGRVEWEGTKATIIGES